MSIKEMGGVAKEVAKQAPSLVIMAVIVFMFIGYLERRDTAFLEMGREFKHAAEKNVEVLGEVKEALRHFRVSNGLR